MGKNKGKHKEQGEKTNVMRMLEAEGVPFLPDGRVDVKVCLWETPEDA